LSALSSEVHGIKVPSWHSCIAGIDLIRGKRRIYVLEDNFCCPSGVSYMLNREIPNVFFLKCLPLTM
jgi:uncharacterized circularly permuted ATP-grasp superfamily protein